MPYKAVSPPIPYKSWNEMASTIIPNMVKEYADRHGSAKGLNCRRLIHDAIMSGVIDVPENINMDDFPYYNKQDSRIKFDVSSITTPQGTTNISFACCGFPVVIMNVSGVVVNIDHFIEYVKSYLEN